MATLYDINQRITALIDEETGEISDIEALEALQLEREDKLENIALWIKNLKADAQMYKAEKQSFADKQKNAEKKIESLTAYLTSALGGEKFSTARVSCSFRKSESVKIPDIYIIPEDYLRYSEPVADKAAIKAAIKSGKEIVGAELITTLNLQIN